MASFGENLRRERESRGVSLRDIANHTKIGVRFLQAIEDDQLDQLPGGIFPRAFVRQYAAYLGLDTRKTLDEFMAMHAPRFEERPATPPRRRSLWFLRPPWKGRLGVGAGVAVIAVALLIGGRDRSASSRAPVPLPAVATEPLPEPPPPPTPVPVDMPGLRLTLTAEQDCWVEIHVDGRAVLNRVLAEGESTTLEAVDEFRLSVGNAGGLALRVNNEPGVSLGRNGEVKKGILINRESLSSFVSHDAPRASSESG